MDAFLLLFLTNLCKVYIKLDTNNDNDFSLKGNTVGGGSADCTTKEKTEQSH
jgi:hypothetical protein